MKIKDIDPKLTEATDVSKFKDYDTVEQNSSYYLIQLEKMMDGALRGIKAANKLKNKEEKLWHLHNVFTNLNKIRGAIAYVSKIL
jgi:hypothetical protein